ncbi:uncharacterized protein LOC125045037 isoform X2 [Penaeus chinensis]|uniref:uncharacterized protein LOC125045037 isoform X2 n=1 Tax=Penaeus chinensis TaxID=139456 RepID=UPI001FB7E281|nr:uncharacterized protein LOC125045037 isoform X2 [Penaeus chinensis]
MLFISLGHIQGSSSSRLQRLKQCSSCDPMVARVVACQSSRCGGGFAEVQRSVAKRVNRLQRLKYKCTRKLRAWPKTSQKDSDK